MAVNLTAHKANELLPISGVKLYVAEAGVRYPNRKDLLIIQLDENSTVGGSFTQNQFCAAPVHLCRQHLESGQTIRALIINTGNANAGTGAEGMKYAKMVCQALANRLKCQEAQILPFSTGVIMEPLPYQRIIDGIPRTRQADWVDAAESIMTTDTVPKSASRRITIDGHTVKVTGIAKGSGMIHPNMATMLGFIATDAAIDKSVISRLTREIAEETFNCITVDGDTSTNDSFIVMATGRCGLPPVTPDQTENYHMLKKVLQEVALELAQAIIRDGEGASKFITIQINGGQDKDECKKVGFAIAQSPLVKTAFYASDPNLGRILAAIGYAGVEQLNIEALDLYLDNVLVAKNGCRNPDYREEQGQQVMQQKEICVRVEMNRGNACATIWTCDLSHEYVSINADYRS